MTGFTQQQESAIADRGRNLLLSAAAGSGKTTVLVERVLRLLLEGARLDRFLIVTFSRAAAADMKDKLKARLEDACEERPELRDSLLAVERSSISTLHSFCSALIKRYFEAAGADPSFRVPEEAEYALITASAMEETVNAACAAGGAGLDHLFFGRSVEAVEALVRGVYDYSRERPDPEAWLEAALLTLPAGDGEIWFQELLHASRREAGDAARLARYAIGLCEGEDGPGVYRGALQSDLELALGAEGLDYAESRRYWAENAPARLGRCVIPAEDSRRAEKEALRDEVKALRESVKDYLKSAATLLIEAGPAMADLAAERPALSALYALVRDYGARLDALLREKSLLSFNDMEHAALRALSGETVAEALKRRYQYVFVDEYQDVSDLQEAILQRIAPANGLFMVGDVKQSIYRFRQAAPRLFLEKYRRYGVEEGGRLIALNRNFRSRPEILDLVNRVFSRAMNGPASEIAYEGDAYLIPGRDFPDDGLRTRAYLIAGDLPAEEDREDEENQLAAAEREAAVAANRVRDLIGTPFYDPRAGAPRPLRPGDFAVIGRTRAAIALAARFLTELGVPVLADAAENLFDTPEIRGAMSLLRLIENRALDAEYMFCLRLEIVGLDEAALARIRAAHAEGSFREAALSYMEGLDEAAARLRAFESLLDTWREAARHLRTGLLIDRALRESGWYAFVGGLPGGAGRQANLQLLMESASSFDAGRSGGLTAFLGYVAEMARQGGAKAGPAAPPDAVSLMTAHGSKGLEYPVVIALQMGRRFDSRKEEGELLTDRALGLGLPATDEVLSSRRDSLPLLAIREKAKIENWNEEIRVLYVTLTRAKSCLLLIGSVASREKSLGRYRALRGSTIRPATGLDAIMPVLEEAGGEAVWLSAEEISRSGRGRDEADMRARARAWLAAPETDADREAEDALSWRYPYEGEAFLPLKLTVTSLARELTGARDLPPITRRPRFLTGEGRSAAERGTLAHQAMAKMDLGALRGLAGEELTRGVRAQLDALVKEGRLPEAPEPRALSDFFAGETGRRLLRAETVLREKPFNLKMRLDEAGLRAPGEVGAESEVVVQGAIDCCFIEDGKWVLLDFKTDKEEDPEALKDLYAPQLRLYALALFHITGIAVAQCRLCRLRRGAPEDVLIDCEK